MLKFLTDRRINHYLRLQYPVEASLSDQGFYVGRYPDLPGCEAVGITPADLYHALNGARRDWISERLRAGASVPAPNSHLADALEPMTLAKTISMAV
ncbi:MAG: type II toxin-antitoxin system HicB family antitoxin [Myxococcota bacterium]